MSLPRIVLLPPELCNQIAAGEVVERPASVVKELVENSLDALSTEVDVRLENGGQGLVRVQDNGIGMLREDLGLALTRHATSKIVAVEDLENINSYGFRGEALPSVASVSRCTLSSAAAGSGEAWTCRVNFGKIEAIEPSPLHRGTVVEIRDLFANVPARLKFLRGIPTEVKHCQEWLSRLALARPDVAFRLESDGRELLNFLPGQSVFERLQILWPEQITENLLPFDRTSNGVRAHGFTARPGVSQPRANRILVFVNGRSVSDKKVFAAVREAYKGRITSRDHPQAVIFLELDPHEVDVNVHPAKSEVRFRDEQGVFRAVLVALRQALEQGEACDRPVTDQDLTAGQEPGDEVARQVDARMPSAPSSFRPQDGTGEAVHPAGFWGRADFPGQGLVRPEREEADIVWQTLPETGSERDTPAAQASFAPKQVFCAGSESRQAMEPGRLAESPQTQPEKGDAVTLAGIACLGQVADTYLVLRDAAGALLLLDQHAAHERVLYARIREKGYRGRGQGLAVPLDLALHPSEAERWQEVRERLAGLGFKARISAGRLVVEAIPALLSRGDAQEFLREALAGQRDDLDARFASMACKSAIKGGDVLTGDEAMNLLGQWLATPDREYCPHGRPIVLRWDRRELEKLFKRRQS